jgi:hypothetical protein
VYWLRHTDSVPRVHRGAGDVTTLVRQDALSAVFSQRMGDCREIMHSVYITASPHTTAGLDFRDNEIPVENENETYATVGQNKRH